MSNHNDKNRLNSGELLTGSAEDNPEPSKIEYMCKNKPKAQQTANPKKYPQGYFKDKKCRRCDTLFSPKAPSEFYCSDDCKDFAFTSKYLERNYNLTYDEYLEIHKKQQGLCYICKTKGFVMAKHHKLKLVVDHDHKTGKVRGLLCHNCNRALGLLHDDIEALKRAIEYLS